MSMMFVYSAFLGRPPIALVRAHHVSELDLFWRALEARSPVHLSLSPLYASCTSLVLLGYSSSAFLIPTAYLLKFRSFLYQTP
jgi:hypothetical protein